VQHNVSLAVRCGQGQAGQTRALNRPLYKDVFNVKLLIVVINYGCGDITYRYKTGKYHSYSGGSQVDTFYWCLTDFGFVWIKSKSEVYYIV
jgi:hypothetical protein